MKLQTALGFVTEFFYFLVVPAAGYVKIQDYASFANWVSGSYSDPLLRGVSNFTRHFYSLH